MARIRDRWDRLRWLRATRREFHSTHDRPGEAHGVRVPALLRKQQADKRHCGLHLMHVHGDCGPPEKPGGYPSAGYTSSAVPPREAKIYQKNAPVASFKLKSLRFHDCRSAAKKNLDHGHSYFVFITAGCTPRRAGACSAKIEPPRMNTRRASDPRAPTRRRDRRLLNRGCNRVARMSRSRPDHSPRTASNCTARALK